MLPSSPPTVADSPLTSEAVEAQMAALAPYAPEDEYATKAIRLARLREAQAIERVMAGFKNSNPYMKPTRWYPHSAHYAHGQLRNGFSCPRDDSEIYFLGPGKLTEDWVGQSKLRCLNAKTGECRDICETISPVCFHVRDDKILFGAMNGGLWYFDRKTEQFVEVRANRTADDNEMNNSFCSYVIPSQSTRETKERLGVVRNSSTKSVEVYEPETMSLCFVQPLPESGPMKSTLMSWIAQSPDKTRAVAVGDMSEVYIFDIDSTTGKFFLRQRAPLTSDSHMCDWSPCGRFVITAENCGQVFDAETLLSLYKISPIHDSFFECCRFAPLTERSICVFAERSKYVHIVDCANPTRHQVINIFPEEVQGNLPAYLPQIAGVCFSSTSYALYVGCQKQSSWKTSSQGDVVEEQAPESRGFIVRIDFCSPQPLRDICAKVIRKHSDKFPLHTLRGMLAADLIEILTLLK